MGIFSKKSKKAGNSSDGTKGGNNVLIKVMDKYKDITHFFLDNAQQNGLNENATRVIITNVVNCVASMFFKPVGKDGIVITMPIILSILKKEELKAVGVVQKQASINEIEIFLREICNANTVNIGDFCCLIVTINEMEYPFYLVTEKTINLDEIPDEIIVIADKKTAVSSGFHKFTVVTEME